ncbi:MAG: ribosome biogenesis GTP-binding protein YihA/YsxC [Methylococcaceae bacterium]
MNPIYRKTHFITSANGLSSAPPDVGSEVAFAGRSNSGKSSAINAITEQKSLARVSKTPGRTQLLNFFRVDDHNRLVDLPGYGYAAVPGVVRNTWRSFLEEYLTRRHSLRGVFLLMDIRHPLTEFDIQMVDWCIHTGLPLHVALTKADKLSRGASMSVLHQVDQTLSRTALARITTQIFSSPKRTGIEQAHQVLDEWLGYTPDSSSSSPPDQQP